jgi:glycosyltransferase involved in cell wall biosynthesis
MTVRVAFHQTPALRPKTGVGHYTSELLGALGRCDGDLCVSGLPSGLLANAYRWAHPLLAGNKSTGGAGRPAAAPSRIKSWLQGGYQSAQQAFFWRLARQLTKAHFDLYHEPNFPILPTDLPTVLTLYDLSLILMPHYHPAERVAAFEKQLPRALEQTSHIITISHFIRAQIIRVLGWPAERVTCTYLGVRPTLKPLPVSQTQATLRALGLPPRYLLYVGTLEPRKNLLRLMQAYCRLPAPLRESCPLLLVGGWGWNIRELAEYFESHARHRGVMHLGYLPEAHLCALYNGARALVYPSLYEGFGLPPLEMMACGGPVLASTAGALKELFGQRAHLVDAEDDLGWTYAMADIIRDDAWHRHLQEGVLVHAGRFTWRRCAEETFNVYRRVVGAKSQRRAA